MPSELRTERRGAALILTISDPATRNTLSTQVIASGIEALGAAESNPEIRVIVVRGDAGQFCAGGNVAGLAERRAAGVDAQRRMLDHLHQWIEAIRVYPKPVLAAVEGAAAGAGFSIALACDLIVAAVDARFVLSHARLGLSPDGGATWSLANALPRALAQQWVWLAEPVAAETLHRHGLVAALAPSGGALEGALALAEKLAAMAPSALASGKELLQLAPGRTLAEQLAAEREHLLTTLFDANGEEGLRAFFEKGAPRFI